MIRVVFKWTGGNLHASTWIIHVCDVRWKGILDQWI